MTTEKNTRDYIARNVAVANQLGKPLVIEDPEFGSQTITYADVVGARGTDTDGAPGTHAAQRPGAPVEADAVPVATRRGDPHRAGRGGKGESAA